MPASLQYRDLAVRCVTSACHLVGQSAENAANRDASRLELQRTFDAAFISAFSEIFNNIAIHAYERTGKGWVKLELTLHADHLVLEISDNGKTFDLSSVPAPELESLPEGGMGIHIARACLDELKYTPGPPNRWRLTKYLREEGEE
jgi:anti-sigma regulatory factor (Ser/Thr protein kinase)